MSDPKERQRAPDELELESETIKDLDVEDAAANEIRGGKCIVGLCGINTAASTTTD